jgi:hypothetical protein
MLLSSNSITRSCQCQSPYSKTEAHSIPLTEKFIAYSSSKQYTINSNQSAVRRIQITAAVSRIHIVAAVSNQSAISRIQIAAAVSRIQIVAAVSNQLVVTRKQ